MGRILIIANTYYQLIMAMQLNHTVFNDDEMYLLLSDHSNGTEQICDRLSEMQVFAGVYYFKTKKKIKGRGIKDKVIDFIQLSLTKSNRYVDCFAQMNNRYFNELLCFNYGVDVEGIYSYLYEYNREIKTSFFEESILSYDIRTKVNLRKKIIKIIRHLNGKKDITETFHDFYCYYPELYHGFLHAVHVPHITHDAKCAQEMKKLFDLQNIGDYYKEKYIFFTSIYDFEGGDAIGEYQLVCNVAHLVGKENLLIKIHPRDPRDIYERNGYKVDKNSTIPWEAIQLSRDFTDKIFLTATSSSVLAGSLMSKKPVKTFYMYKCCDIKNNKVAQVTVTTITNLLSDQTMKNILSGVNIVEEVGDILK